MNTLAPLKCGDPTCRVCARSAQVAAATADIYEQRGDTDRADYWRLVAEAYAEGLIEVT